MSKRGIQKISGINTYVFKKKYVDIESKLPRLFYFNCYVHIIIVPKTLNTIDSVSKQGSKDGIYKNKNTKQNKNTRREVQLRKVQTFILGHKLKRLLQFIFSSRKASRARRTTIMNTNIASSRVTSSYLPLVNLTKVHFGLQFSTMNLK